MNYRKILAALGIIIMLIGGSMLLPILWSLYYGDSDWWAFVVSALITFIVGFIAYNKTSLAGDFRQKEAFAVVVFGWFFASLFGTLPYLLAGTFTSFADAFFETMSGFTTTGSSVLADVESLPHGVLFWRSLTHWLGGMGIVVLFVALLSSFGVGGMQMFKAEFPGPVAEKIKPRISQTAKILWYTYLIMTGLAILSLYLLGMPFFDALCHAFSTVAIGGFSTKNASIGYYDNPLIQWAIIIIMFLAGINFSLYYLAFRARSLKRFWQNGEFRFYVGLMAGLILIVTVILLFNTDQPFSLTFRQASFQVISILTTTGFATADYDAWPYLGKAILVTAMFIGACSGSTGGAIKIGRILILLKSCRLELQRAMHPRAIFKTKIDGKAVSPEVLGNVLQFFFIYIAITSISTVFMTGLGLELVDAFTSVAASLGNVGPGLGMVGPAQNYGFISAPGKLYLSFLMLLGRLELFTLLVLFLPSFWKR